MALILLKKHFLPPNEWNHDPNLKDERGNTGAMLLAMDGIIPPE